jgi:hypothetical protein
MRSSLLLALIPLDFGLGRTGQKRFIFRIACYILNLELLSCIKAFGKVGFYEKRRESSPMILGRDEPSTVLGF